MKHIIHVHQQKIKKGLDAIIDRTYKGSRHSRGVVVMCPSCGTEAARIVQSDVPDRCGARVWIEAESVMETGKRKNTND